MVILPSLIEKNFYDFSLAVGKLQKIVGTHFSPIQGGVYSNPDIANIMNFVEKKGFMGVGQSSWGPTGFILTDSDTAAHKLTKEIKQMILQHTSSRKRLNKFFYAKTCRLKLLAVETKAQKLHL